MTQRALGWVLTLAAVAGVVGAGLWADQGEAVIAAAVLVAGLGCFLARAQLDGLVNVVAPLSRVGAASLERGRVAARSRPDMRTAKAAALVGFLVLVVVGLQLAPVVGVLSESADTDGVASAAPGDEEWTYETGDNVRSSPTVVNGTVYIGNDDGNVYALDAADGTEQWRFTAGSAVTTSPTVVNGTVYVGSEEIGRAHV